MRKRSRKGRKERKDGKGRKKSSDFFHFLGFRTVLASD
jgi:hypothetical protein